MSNIIQADASGRIVADPTTQAGAEYKLTRFPQGNPFVHQPHPNRPGNFIVRDGSGTIVGVVNNEGVADLICRACHWFMVEADKVQAAVAAESDKLADGLEAANITKLGTGENSNG